MGEFALLKIKYKILFLILSVAILGSGIFLYIQYVNSEYNLQHANSQYYLQVNNADFLENSKDISGNESLLHDYNLSYMFKYAEIHKKTNNPSDELRSISILSYNSGQELILILDELFENTETIKNQRSYNVVFDEKYFVIFINYCGGQCPPYD